jgi:hypothetical protein
MKCTYQRPELTEDQKRTLALAALQVNQIPDPKRRVLYIGALIAENARLIAECNEHRAARGFELLPGYAVIARSK